ncbi:hypothetical protein R1sor_026411 [Riccia sorocarpa]|uniref:Uncharacterized protein n=1 Tax=Riccia sorocarpa TaxID=122646 RepID=A0ABD3GBX9_9MARC
MQSNQNYKILERESIKEALTAGFFGVMAKEPSHYLPHPDCVKKSRESAVVQAEDGGDEDDIDDEEFAEDIRQTQRHKKDRWDAAKNIVAEKTRLSRESDNDARRLKRERDAMNVPTPPPKKHQSVSTTPLPKKQQYVTPSPPPKKKPVEVEEITTEEEEESESDGKDDGAGATAVEEESNSPPAKKVNTKRGSKLKTLKKIESVAGIDREKQEKRRKAVERCRASSVVVTIFARVYTGRADLLAASSVEFF